MNIFVTFLKLLEVKHTNCFSERYYNEHPHKYDMYGISSMLSDYGIENIVLKIDNKQNNLPLLDTLFIAHTDKDFVAVHRKTPEMVDYIWKNKKISVSVDEFIKTWSGIVLLAEPAETSGEPEYRTHQYKALYQHLAKYLLLFLCFLSVSMQYISQQLFHHWEFSFSLFLNLSGIYVCYLLIQKQIKIQGSYADKICSLFRQGDCNILLCFPHLVSFLAIFNICILPYTFWSIGYQRRIKQWCPLCLVVQGLLWGIFTINLLAGLIRPPLFSIMNLLWVVSIYLIPLLSASLLLSILLKSVRMEEVNQAVNSLKVNEDVFLTLLKKQLYYPVTGEDSEILFGNPESKMLITVFTNPHCRPCAKIHASIEKLLVETKNQFCIQYIFASFNKELASSSQFLINVYHDYPDKALHIYNEWFDSGKFQKETMFAKYGFNPDNYYCEHISHKAWQEKHKITTTPTVLVNGYQLPEIYQFEDLRFVAGFNVIPQ